MEKIITIAQAAEYLGVSRQTIKNWIDNGIIKTHGVAGKQYWIDANTLTAFKDTAEDVERQKEKLAHLKAELHKSISEEQMLVNEISKLFRTGASNQGKKSLLTIRSKKRGG